jgi:hypothetical protein
MNPNKQCIKEHLQAFNFKAPFREELGWDNPKSRPFTIDYQGQSFTLTPLADKHGVQILLCSPDEQGRIPDDKTLKHIDRQVEKYAQEHLIIFIDSAQEHQTWLWAKYEYKKYTAYRIHKLRKGQSGESLAQRLITLAIELEGETKLAHQEIADRLKKGFDVEKITKKFYDCFKKEHASFFNFIQGIPSQSDREWYTSVMLNRLMFIYFIQKKGFLGTTSKYALDGDPHYLRNRLKMSQEHNGSNTFHSFYRYFLLRFFSEGLNARDRTLELERLLGNVPYLNGGIFDVHQLERDYPEIQISDEAFDCIFRFFDEWSWHLDNCPDKEGNEINPDVLGYIFERYISQKQMGVYYTKEDSTEYIGKNTIIPFIFESAQQKCSIAFMPDGPVWSLLCDNPDDYIYEAVAKGISLSLPSEIEAGMTDIARRGDWNKVAEEEYALPTETWREVVERRKRYAEIHEKIVQGKITSINDLITYNFDIGQFAQDVVTYCEGSDLLLAFYESIEQVTVLDPTCGSGAFLFAALNILQPLYAACLDRMQNFVDERDQLDKAIEPYKRKRYYQIDRFRDILKQIAKHHSREYFILKSIIINNLYGVDVMKEAVEICKLRLFLKLVAQVEKPDDIEPLPDIDFNVLAGNTLAGFTSLDEVRSAVEKDISMQAVADEILQYIEQRAKDLERAVENFRKIQTIYEIELDHTTSAEYKQEVRNKLDELRSELNLYLAMNYGFDHNNILDEQQYQQKYAEWLKNHQPFHWFVEFYSIMKKGGFNVIIGNPPYAEYYEKNFSYKLQNFETLSCANLYPCVIERSYHLLLPQGYHGMIVPLSAFSTKNMTPFIENFTKWFSCTYNSFYHFRPSMLFAGGKVASIPTTIYIAKIEGKERHFSTGVMKWSNEHRDILFPSLVYSQITTSKDPANCHYYPKYGLPIENAIMQKVLQHRTVKSYLANAPNQNIMYYRSAGGLYWKIFINVAWPYQTTSNKQCFFQESYDRDIFVALFNSSLFWWYYTVTFDTFNLKDYMIFGFRFSYPKDHATINTLKQACHHLMDDFKANAKHLTRGKTGSYTVYAKKSKPIIDEIDRVLAKHYGFTDEELDFIINYDIKYRMGRDNGDEE